MNKDNNKPFEAAKRGASAAKGFRGSDKTKRKPYDPRKQKPSAEGLNPKSGKPFGHKDDLKREARAYKGKDGLKPGDRLQAGGKTSPQNGRPLEKAPGAVRRETKSVEAGSARLVALRALYDVYYLNTYSNLSLDKQLKGTALSAEDRRLATNIFYQCVENRYKIDFMLSPFVKQEPEQIITCILHIAAAQIMFLDRVPDFAAVNEAVNQAKLYKRESSAGFVNVVLRNLLRAKEANEIHLPKREDDPYKYLEIEYSASEDTVKLLADAFGLDETEKILAYKPSERRDTVRPNLLRTSDDALEQSLTEQGIQWENAPVPHGYYVKNAGGMAQSDIYRQGLISIQGVSAMLAAMALEPGRGMNIVDACAAPGGKAAYICELMQGSGRVYAWDLHEHRVELMKQNGKRLGLDNLRCAVRDATVLKEDMTRLMDGVLIDAPCSGLGVIADKPDIKYHLTKAKFYDIVKTQRALLDTCCEYVKVGGRLVYSTCTLLPEENEKQIEQFLLSHPEFRLDTSDSYLPEHFKPLLKDGMLTLMEHRDGVEGFFIARLIRVI